MAEKVGEFRARSVVKRLFNRAFGFLVIGDWALISLLAGSARAEEREDLFDAGEFAGDEWHEISGGSAKADAMDTECRDGRGTHAEAGKFAPEVSLAAAGH